MSAILNAVASSRSDKNSDDALVWWLCPYLIANNSVHICRETALGPGQSRLFVAPNDGPQWMVHTHTLSAREAPYRTTDVWEQQPTLAPRTAFLAAMITWWQSRLRLKGLNSTSLFDSTPTSQQIRTVQSSNSIFSWLSYMWHGTHYVIYGDVLGSRAYSRHVLLVRHQYRITYGFSVVYTTPLTQIYLLRDTSAKGSHVWDFYELVYFFLNHANLSGHCCLIRWFYRSYIPLLTTSHPVLGAGNHRLAHPGVLLYVCSQTTYTGVSRLYKQYPGLKCTNHSAYARFDDFIQSFHVNPNISIKVQMRFKPLARDSDGSLRWHTTNRFCCLNHSTRDPVFCGPKIWNRHNI